MVFPPCSLVRQPSRSCIAHTAKKELSFHCLATSQTLLVRLCCYSGAEESLLVEQRLNNNTSTKEMLMNTVLDIYCEVHVVTGLCVNTPRFLADDD